MAEKITYIFEAETGNFVKQVNGINKEVMTLKGNYGTLGGVVAAGSAAFVGAGAAMFGAAGMASDLTESINVVNQVFKDGAADVIAWSETSIEAMGISQTQALKTAGLFGTLGVSLPVDESQAMAKELTQLSADMASFNNVSQEQAALALKGIYTGESEALMNLGANIQVANLEQYGYNENMTQAEKIQIRYQAAMDQTAVQQGDFARSTGTLAQEQRIFTEKLKEVVTTIGTLVMPAVTNIVSLLNDGLSVALALVTGDTSKLNTEQMAMYTSFVSIIPLLQTIGIIIGVLAVAYAGLAIVLAVLKLQQDLITASTAIKTAVDWLQNTAIWAQVAALWAQAVAFLAVYWPILLIIAGIALLIVAYLKFEVVQNIINALLNVVINTLMALAGIIVGLVIGAINALQVVVTTLIDVALMVLKAMLEQLMNTFQLLSDIINLVITIALFPFQLALALLSGDMDAVKGVIGNLASAFGDTLTSALNVVMTPINFVIDLFQRLWDMITGITDAIVGGLVGALNSIPFVNIGGKLATVGGYDTLGSGPGELGQGTSNVYNYNIQYGQKPSLRDIRSASFAFRNNGGSYV